VYSSNGALATSLTGHSPNSPLTSLSANCDNTLFASASSAASLILYNRTTNTQYSLGVKPKAPYSVIQFAPTRRTFLAAATTTGLLHLFDTTKPSAPIRTISLSPSPLPSAITNLAFSPVGPLLLACTATGSLSLIDTEKCKVVVSHEVGVEVEKGRMALAPDGRTAVLAGKGVVRVLDIKTRKGVKEIAIKEGARLGGLAFQACLDFFDVQTEGTTLTSASSSSLDPPNPSPPPHLPRLLNPLPRFSLSLSTACVPLTAASPRQKNHRRRRRLLFPRGCSPTSKRSFRLSSLEEARRFISRWRAKSCRLARCSQVWLPPVDSNHRVRRD
jgi:hypothetical protein